MKRDRVPLWPFLLALVIFWSVPLAAGVSWWLAAERLADARAMGCDHG